MKKITSKHLMPKLMLAFFVLSGIGVFAAQNETVSRAFVSARPEVRVQVAGTVKRADQTVSVEAVEAVNSGEILDWTIDSINAGTADAKNYSVVGQIPVGTAFVANSAKGDDAPQITYSIDGGKTFAAEPLIDEKQPDGSTKLVAAPVSIYTQLRFEWAKSLPANAKLTTAYRVRVK